MSGDYELLGPITITQIHIDRMVNHQNLPDGSSPRVYEADKIVSVEELWVGQDGLLGIADGVTMMHGHHRLHPNKTRAQNPKKFMPGRLLCVGFTSHYEMIADRFGGAAPGIGAEDIIVEHDSRVMLDDLAAGVQIRTAAGAIELHEPMVAKPCIPFTNHLLGSVGEDTNVVVAHQSFLDNGMRGFVFGLEEQHQPMMIKTGDTLWRKI